MILKIIVKYAFQSIEREMIGGYIVLRAINFKQAIELSKKCPLLNIGGSIEIWEAVKMH